MAVRGPSEAAGSTRSTDANKLSAGLQLVARAATDPPRGSALDDWLDQLRFDYPVLLIRLPSASRR